MADNIILLELQKLHKALTETTDYQFTFRMVKSTERFKRTYTKLVLISLSVYIAVFIVNKNKISFYMLGNFK